MIKYFRIRKISRFHFQIITHDKILVHDGISTKQKAIDELEKWNSGEYKYE